MPALIGQNSRGLRVGYLIVKLACLRVVFGRQDAGGGANQFPNKGDRAHSTRSPEGFFVLVSEVNIPTGHSPLTFLGRIANQPTQVRFRPRPPRLNTLQINVYGVFYCLWESAGVSKHSGCVPKLFYFLRTSWQGFWGAITTSQGRVPSPLWQLSHLESHL